VKQMMMNQTVKPMTANVFVFINLCFNG